MSKHIPHMILAVLFFCLTACTSTRSIASNNEAAPASAQLPYCPVVADAPRPQPVNHNELTQKLEQVLNDPLLQETQVALYIYDLTADQPLFAHGYRQRMRPASTMKVVTAITALSQLGVNYQYATRAYANGKISGNQLNGNLYIYGGFNPLFDEKDMSRLVLQLQRQGIRKIQGSIVLDNSFKDSEKAGWGWCWDDKNPSLVPLLYKGKNQFATALSRELSRRGIRTTGRMKNARIPQNSRQIACVETPIDSILKPMMKHSVNQDAESMFYQIAGQARIPYASRKTAAQYVHRFIENELHLNPGKYQIADGSGLSLYNYITPELLVHYLRYAYQHPDIYQHLYESLPIAGEDGTLKRRMKNTPAAGNVRAKTGTLTGISSLAGYVTAANGHQLCFAIINQGQIDNDDARDFQDNICLILSE